jgi:hypothetical protein
MNPADGLSEMDEPTRREFAAALALLAVAPALPAQQPRLPAEVAGQLEPLVALVKAKYGKHLNEDQLKAVARGIARNLVTSQRLNRTKLKNADEPSVVFSSDLP